MFGFKKNFCNTLQVKKFRKGIFQGNDQIWKCSEIQPPLEIDFDRIDQPIGILKYFIVQTTFYEDFTFCISEVDFYPWHNWWNKEKRLIPKGPLNIT